jgi:LDH2 family malate/lactate/ureidoglycolate dehydrogenase
VGLNKNESSGVGHFFAAVKIDAFREPEDFKRDMDALFDQLKNAPKAAGQDRIYIHGEKEFELYDRYTKTGVPLMKEVVRGLEEVGEQVGVPFDLEVLGEV